MSGDSPRLIDDLTHSEMGVRTGFVPQQRCAQMGHFEQGISRHVTPLETSRPDPAGDPTGVDRHEMRRNDGCVTVRLGSCVRGPNSEWTVVVFSIPYEHIRA